MTNEEFKKLTEEYLNATMELHNYVERCTSPNSYHQPIEKLNLEKVKAIIQRRDEAEKKYFEVAYR